MCIKKINLKLSVFLFTLICLTCGSEFAFATFNEQLAISTKAIALANAVTANPPGVMSLHYNPAGLSLLGEGKILDLGTTMIHLVKKSSFKQAEGFPGFMDTFKDDPLDGTSGTNTNGVMYLPGYNDTIPVLTAPAVGVSFRKKNSPWTFAVGQYAPFAVGLEHGNSDDPARFGGKKVYQQHLIYLSPGASYQINDKLSVGVSVGMGQTAMGANVDMRAPSEILALTKVLGDATKDGFLPILSDSTFTTPWFGGGISPYEQIASFDMNLRSDFAPNYNIGLLWQPKWFFSFGICYQSPIKAHLHGKYKFKYSESWQRLAAWNGKGVNMPWTVLSPPQVAKIFNLPDKAIPEQSGTVFSDIEFPQRVQMGIKISPVRPLRIMFDVSWADWSVVKEDRFVFDQDIQLLQFVKMSGYAGGDDSMVIKRNMKDTIHWSVGAELQLLDWLCLRAGYEKRPSSVQDNLYDLMYALPDLNVYGTGIGMKFKNGLVIDLAASYVVNESYKVGRNGSKNLNYENWTYPVYNPYVGLEYEQETKTYMVSASFRAPIDLMIYYLSKPVQALDKFVFWRHK